VRGEIAEMKQQIEQKQKTQTDKGKDNETINYR
jgi:hypothetical protein